MAEKVDEEKPSSTTTLPCSSNDVKSLPFKCALRALENATVAIGEPHVGVSAAIETARTCNAHVLTSFPASTKCDQPAAVRTKSYSTTKVPVGCRVGLNIVEFLAGSGGYDAMGRDVGVAPGQNVEAAVLNDGSQVRVDTVTYVQLLAFEFSSISTLALLRTFVHIRNDH